MGGAVFADQTRAVDGKGDVQILQGDVVYQLVVGALQKGGVDRHYRLLAFTGHACRQCHRVLLGDGHIVKALGEVGGKFHHA